MDGCRYFGIKIYCRDGLGGKSSLCWLIVEFILLGAYDCITVMKFVPVQNAFCVLLIVKDRV